MAQLIVKKYYQSINMEVPIAPGVYDHTQLERDAIDAMLEQRKAVWVNGAPAEWSVGAQELPEQPDFLSMTVAQLTDYAAAHNIVLPSGAKKLDIVALVMAAAQEPVAIIADETAPDTD